MKRLDKLEGIHRDIVARIADLKSNVPDGRAPEVMAISALYKALFDILSDELKLAPELGLGEPYVNRIKAEREYALFNAEFWRGSAIGWADDAAGALEPVS